MNHFNHGNKKEDSIDKCKAGGRKGGRRMGLGGRASSTNDDCDANIVTQANRKKRLRMCENRKRVGKRGR